MREEGRTEGGRRGEKGVPPLSLLCPSSAPPLSLLCPSSAPLSGPSRVLKAAGDCCPSTGTSRGLGLSGSTANQTPITTIAGAASRGAQRRLLQRLALLERLPTQMMTPTAAVARPPQRLVPQ